MFTSNLPYVFPFFLFVSSHLCLCHITFTFIFNGLPVATHLLSGPSSSLSKTRSSLLSFIFWYCLLLLSPASSAKYSRLQSSSASKCEAIQLPTITCTSEALICLGSHICCVQIKEQTLSFGTGIYRPLWQACIAFHIYPTLQFYTNVVTCINTLMLLKHVNIPDRTIQTTLGFVFHYVEEYHSTVH